MVKGSVWHCMAISPSKALLQFHCLQLHLFHCLQLHSITAEANLLCVPMKPVYLCGIPLHTTMAGANLSASAVTKWPAQAAGGHAACT